MTLIRKKDVSKFNTTFYQFLLLFYMRGKGKLAKKKDIIANI